MHQEIQTPLFRSSCPPHHHQVLRVVLYVLFVPVFVRVVRVFVRSCLFSCRSCLSLHNHSIEALRREPFYLHVLILGQSTIAKTPSRAQSICSLSALLPHLDIIAVQAKQKQFISTSKQRALKIENSHPKAPIFLPRPGPTPHILRLREIAHGS